MRASTNEIREMALQGPSCRDPGAIDWNYTRAETIADLAIHVVGLCFGLIAAGSLLVHAALHAPTMNIVAASIYSLGLLSVLTFSAAYNLWPVCPVKWWLRRFDQSAIYLLIAATYTAFVVDTKAGTTAVCVLIGIWCIADWELRPPWPCPDASTALQSVFTSAWGGALAFYGASRRYPCRSGPFCSCWPEARSSRQA